MGSKLDLRPFAATVDVQMEGYEFSLPADLPLAILTEIRSVCTAIGAAEDTEQTVAAEERLWPLLETIMAHAKPQPATPVRELFTPIAAVRLLDFLVRAHNSLIENEKRSKRPSASPTSTAAE